MRTLLVCFQLYYFVEELTGDANFERLGWKERLNPLNIILSTSIIDLGLLTFLIEFLIIIKHGLCTGQFSLKDLNLLSVAFLTTLFCVLIGSTSIVRMEVGRGGAKIIKEGKNIY